MLSLISRWLKPGWVSIVCIAVMLLTIGCAGSSASHTRTSSRQVLATFGEFFIPTLGAAPADITQGPCGALWFTEELGNKIGRITAGGDFAEYVLPTRAAFPLGITLGPDGALWFTENLGNKIGRITSGGKITEYPLSTPGSEPASITSEGDSALWFTEIIGKIERITT